MHTAICHTTMLSLQQHTALHSTPSPRTIVSQTPLQLCCHMHADTGIASADYAYRTALQCITIEDVQIC
eukprot:13472-Heterococcus_DN1.PRE.2